MKHHRDYNTSFSKRIALVLLVAVTIFAGWWIGTSECRAAEEKPLTCWVMCKPGSYVSVRRSPQKNAMTVGRLDPCDKFETDGKTKNGYLHAIGIDVADGGEGWIHSGYVVTEEPEAAFEQYYCSSLSRVACRRWISGPRVENYGWIVNGSTVQVFYRTEEWSCTNRGYIKSEFLERDPQ